MIRIRMIGEMSMPPRLGMKRRMGRRAGSVTRHRNSPIMETTWLRVLITPKWTSQERIAEPRLEEHTSELQSLMRISYAVFCLKKTNKTKTIETTHQTR